MTIVAVAGRPYEIKLCDGAGHEFDRESPPDAAVVADAWQRTTVFFAKEPEGRLASGHVPVRVNAGQRRLCASASRS